jgi:hypothetical protein
MRIFLGDFFVLISFIVNDAHFIELRGYKKQNSAGKMEGAVKNLFVFTLTSTGAVVTVTVGAERGRGFGSCL